MSDYEQKDNSGAIFKNDKKETDSHPDYKGSARVAGIDYWVSVWVNTSAKGNKYMSTSFTAKEQVQKQAIKQAKEDMTIQELDDDIPF
jgi:uncharacterized protein (DUF736 family)